MSTIDRLKKFHCLPEQGEFNGTCAGLAYAFELPTWLVRVFVFFIIASFPVLFFLYIFMPEIVGESVVSPEEFEAATGDPEELD